MSKRIKEGDLVTLHWSGHSYNSILTGRVIRTPQGAGDSWQIDVGDTVWLVNVYASYFESMERRNEDE